MGRSRARPRAPSAAPDKRAVLLVPAAMLNTTPRAQQLRYHTVYAQKSTVTPCSPGTVATFANKLYLHLLSHYYKVSKRPAPRIAPRFAFIFAKQAHVVHYTRTIRDLRTSPDPPAPPGAVGRSRARPRAPSAAPDKRAVLSVPAALPNTTPCALGLRHHTVCTQKSTLTLHSRDCVTTFPNKLYLQLL